MKVLKKEFHKHIKNYLKLSKKSLKIKIKII